MLEYIYIDFIILYGYMRKLILFFVFILSGSNLKAETETTFRLGSGIELINGGLGLRHFSGNVGYDLSLDGGTSVAFSEICLRKHLLFRKFHGNDYFYAGPGLGFGFGHMYAPLASKDAFGPGGQASFMLGHAWKRSTNGHTFIQLEAGVGAFVGIRHHNMGLMLPIRLTTGISF